MNPSPPPNLPAAGLSVAESPAESTAKCTPGQATPTRLALLAVLLSVVALVVALRPMLPSLPIPPDTLSQILASRTLRVGYIVFPPSIVKDPTTGAVTGHLVAAMREIAKPLALNLEFVEATWTTFILDLRQHRVDVSIAPTFRTIPRAAEVSFTRPVFYFGNSAVCRRGDPRFRSLADLSLPGITVAVTQGEQGHEYAKANLPSATIVALPGSNQHLAFAEVSAGRADVALGDAWMTSKYAKLHTEVVDLLAAHPYNVIGVGWAVRPGDDTLVRFLDTAIESLETSGRLVRLEAEAGAPFLHQSVTWKATTPTAPTTQ